MSFPYLLHLSDNVMILGQRLSEWCGHGPALEEDIALTNTALDYLGQATHLYGYAGQIEGKGKDADQLAFLRDAWDFKNALMVELPNGDYAFTIGRQFLFSSWYYFVLRELKSSSDSFLTGFAEKSIKEVSYHLEHSSDWVIRLGDGTEESHSRMQTAVHSLWEFTGELFIPADYETEAVAAGIAPDVRNLQEEWREFVTGVFTQAALNTPADGYMQTGGKKGTHTENLGFILADMQFLQRAYPGAKW